MDSKRAGVLARQLICFAVFIFLVNLVLHLTHHYTSIKHLRSMVTAEGRDDSWHVMWPALKVSLDGEPGMYSKVFFQQHIKYIDPPTALLLPWFLYELKPSGGFFQIEEELNFIGWAATWGFVLISIGLLIVPIRSSDGTGIPSNFFERHAKLICIVAVLILAFLFYPATIAVTLGQTQPSVIFLLTLALLFWLRGSKVFAGVCIGIATLIKPPLLLFLIWGALRRERSFLLAFSATYATGLLASILIFGFQAHFEYLSVLHYVGQRGESLYANQSINGLLNRLLQPQEFRGWYFNKYPPFHPLVFAGTILNTFLMMGLALFLPHKNNRGTVLDFAGMALAIVLASTLAWEHNYALLFPVYAILLHQPDIPRVLIAISYTFVACCLAPLVNIMTPPWNIVQSYLLFGALVGGALIYRKLSRKESVDSSPERISFQKKVALST